MRFWVLCMRMRLRRGELERIEDALAEADVDGEALTAREILGLLEEHGHGEAFESPHRVATVLGRHAGGAVEVIRDRPYQYRLSADESG